jgi:hypothetical protein
LTDNGEVVLDPLVVDVRVGLKLRHGHLAVADALGGRGKGADMLGAGRPQWAREGAEHGLETLRELSGKIGVSDCEYEALEPQRCDARHYDRQGPTQPRYDASRRHRASTVFLRDRMSSMLRREENTFRADKA